MFFTLSLSKIKKLLIKIVYGIPIGASVIIPGLSGGTVAMLLGVFNEMLDAADSLVKSFKKSFSVLSMYAIGAIFGIILVAFPLRHILENHELLFSYFVIGIILGGIPVFLPKRKTPLLHSLLLVSAGAVPVIIQSKFLFHIESNNIIVVSLIGFISAIALILPGISLTNILISFGCYKAFIEAITNIDIRYLSVFSVSMCLGIISTVKILNYVYSRHSDRVNLIILGMILASISQIYVGIPSGLTLMSAILLFIGGALLSCVFRLFKK